MSVENADLRSELGIALERQAVTAQILNVISMSRTDVQPVFDVISESSRRLLGGQTALVTRVLDGMLHLAASTTGSRASHREIRASFPAPLSSQRIHSRAAMNPAMAFEAIREVIDRIVVTPATSAAAIPLPCKVSPALSLTGSTAPENRLQAKTGHRPIPFVGLGECPACPEHLLPINFRYVFGSSGQARG